MDVDVTQDGSSSLTSTTEDINQGSQPQEQAPQLPPSIQELEKLEKFKFQGQEYTPKDLEAAVMRLKDYTQKTQALASDRKYYENLYADLDLIRQNPSLASEFVKVYPQKFHGYVRQILQSGANQSTGQSQQQMQQPMQDVDLMSRLSTLEKFYHEQEIAKQEVVISSQITKLSKKYPDAIPELAIGRVYEAYNQLKESDPGAELTEQMWEDTFKAVDDQMKTLVKTKYGELVKKQTKANDKGKAPDAGGGTPGRAPAKFKSLKEVTEYAATDLSGRR